MSWVFQSDILTHHNIHLISQRINVPSRENTLVSLCYCRWTQLFSCQFQCFIERCWAKIHVECTQFSVSPIFILGKAWQMTMESDFAFYEKLSVALSMVRILNCTSEGQRSVMFYHLLVRVSNRCFQGLTFLLTFCKHGTPWIAQNLKSNLSLFCSFYISLWAEYRYMCTDACFSVCQVGLANSWSVLQW